MSESHEFREKQLRTVCSHCKPIVEVVLDLQRELHNLRIAELKLENKEILYTLRRRTRQNVYWVLGCAVLVNAVWIWGLSQ